LEFNPMFSLNKKLIVLTAALFIIASSLIFLKPTNAGLLFEAKDALSRTATSVAANHEFSFTTNLSTDITENETIIITFPSSFAVNLNGVDCEDIDILDDGSEEDINNEAGGCGATATEWGTEVNIARTLTLIAPSNAGTYIAGSSTVIIRIGTNTTNESVGNEQITNPAATGSYFIQIGGTFGDSKTITINIVANDQVTVEAKVIEEEDDDGGEDGEPPPPPPPDPEPEPEEDVVAPIISNIQIINITNDSAEIVWETNEGSTTIINYGRDVLYGSRAEGVAFVLNHSVVLEGLDSSTTYHFVITSADAWGNTAISGDQSFTTAARLPIPPPCIGDECEEPEEEEEPDEEGEAVPEEEPLPEEDVPPVETPGGDGVIAGVEERAEEELGCEGDDCFEEETDTEEANEKIPPEEETEKEKVDNIAKTSDKNTPETGSSRKNVWNKKIPVAENIINVSKNVTEKIDEGSQIVVEKVLDNPEVEKVNENIAAPTVAAVAIVSYGTAISFSGLLPFLQFLFTQPLLLLFPKKRKGWGVVYNSLSKIPVDLAIVRLYNKETNKLVQTRVTDREGRFAFFVNPGKYNIAVSKPNFNFPSVYMKDKKEDIQFLDIYHGEELTVNEKDTTITPNIPLDPIESKGIITDKKIILGYFSKRVQDLVALTGLLVTMASVIISPKPWMFGLLAGHAVLFLVMKRVARAKKPQNWGVVYDKNTKKPLGLTVARIFEKEYNKLLETQVTDANGRYSFLVGNNVYYATFSKPDFKPRKTDDIDLTAKEKGAAVRFNVALEKN